MSADRAELVLDGVSVNFGHVAALTQISVAFEADVITGIIGPNGSGKSTLVNAVTGWVRPAQGQISWQGEPIRGLRPYRIVRLGVARTFQHAMAFPELTVDENVRISIEATGKRPDDVRDLLFDCDHFDALWSHRQAAAADLPFGLARLLGIAMALASRPRLMMLDEPAAGLNDHESRALGKAIAAIRDLGVGVVVIDHDMAFLLPLCSRVVVLDAGIVLADGTPQEVRSDPRVVATYLGEGFASGT